MNRRSFVKSSAWVSLGFMGLYSCVNRSGETATIPKTIKLEPDPGNYLDLPEGFSYNIISKSGTEMSDGFLVPGRPDGMGTFLNGEGMVVIVRNHENNPEALATEALFNSPFGREQDKMEGYLELPIYDAGYRKNPGVGGTTTLIFDETEGQVKEEYLSLAGTYRNCAGGITPWGSWLTCEEDVTNGNDEFAEQDHGYVFEVPAFAKGLAEPKPIKAMGRFNHEAVAVDPQSSIVYLTEDRSDGLIYRFIPNSKENMFGGGILQALVIKGQKSCDTRNWEEEKVKENEAYEVEWITLENIDTPEDDLRQRGFEAGAARFARGEGIWMGKGEIFIACTNGGSQKCGQIFRYVLSENEGEEGEKESPATLELFIESKSKSVLHMCDNLTISPTGDIFICEDNGELNRIHLVDQKGNISLFAVNRYSNSEFAGPVFSPSGKTMFVNIQESGDTIAITGPWSELKLG
ncbi:MAG: alkaline phosphatase PhoX [Bacteroidota bacterium]